MGIETLYDAKEVPLNKHKSLECFQKLCYRCCRQSADHEDLA